MKGTDGDQMAAFKAVMPIYDDQDDISSVREIRASVAQTRVRLVTTQRVFSNHEQAFAHSPPSKFNGGLFVQPSFPGASSDYQPSFAPNTSAKVVQVKLNGFSVAYVRRVGATAESFSTSTAPSLLQHC